MGENLFAKFNEMFDTAGLQADIQSAASNTGEFVEVPEGDYEVKIVKLEPGINKTKGTPQGVVWFEILAGEFKGQKLFMYQSLTSGFGFHKMNEFLTSLETDIPVVFENFNQYEALLKQMFNAVDGTAEYQLNYSKNSKGFNVFTIVQRF